MKFIRSLKNTLILRWKKSLAANRGRSWVLVCDVDGVLTDGKFWYSNSGKELKVFGSHDSDALKLNTFFSRVEFVTADHRGLGITKTRLADMGWTVQLLDSVKRQEFVEELKVEFNVVFVGDSFSDVPAMKSATLSAAPFGAFPDASRCADIKLSRRGSDGALAELLQFLEGSRRQVVRGRQ